MVKKLEVKLTNQNFKEAGGLEVYPNLEIGGVITALAVSDHDSFSTLVERINEQLSKKAAELGYTHVFGVEYSIDEGRYGRHPCYGKDYKAVATGYRPKKCKQKGIPGPSCKKA